MKFAVFLYGTMAPSTPSGSRPSRQALMHASQRLDHSQARMSGLSCTLVITARMKVSTGMSASAAFSSSRRDTRRSRSMTIGGGGFLVSVVVISALVISCGSLLCLVLAAVRPLVRRATIVDAQRANGFGRHLIAGALGRLERDPPAIETHAAFGIAERELDFVLDLLAAGLVVLDARHQGRALGEDDRQLVGAGEVELLAGLLAAGQLADCVAVPCEVGRRLAPGLDVGPEFFHGRDDLGLDLFVAYYLD